MQNTKSTTDRFPLLPCPFCGGEVQTKPFAVPGITGVLCDTCGAVVSFRESPDNPAAWWNRREGVDAAGIAAEMLRVLKWLDTEMDVRDNEYGSVLFSRHDFARVRRVIQLAVRNRERELTGGSHYIRGGRR